MSLTAISSAAWADPPEDDRDPVSGRSAPMTISDSNSNSDSDAASEVEPTKPTKSSSIPITATAFAVIVMYLRGISVITIKAFRAFAVK